MVISGKVSLLVCLSDYLATFVLIKATCFKQEHSPITLRPVILKLYKHAETLRSFSSFHRTPKMEFDNYMQSMKVTLLYAQFKATIKKHCSCFPVGIAKTYTSFKQCYQDDVSIIMTFIKHVLTEFVEVYSTSKLYWQSNRIYIHCISTLQLNEML